MVASAVAAACCPPAGTSDEPVERDSEETRLRRSPRGEPGDLGLVERLGSPMRLLERRSGSRPTKGVERACPLLSVDCSQLPMVSSTPSSSISLDR